MGESPSPNKPATLIPISNETQRAGTTAAETTHVMVHLPDVGPLEKWTILASISVISIRSKDALKGLRQDVKSSSKMPAVLLLEVFR